MENTAPEWEFQAESRQDVPWSRIIKLTKLKDDRRVRTRYVRVLYNQYQQYSGSFLRCKGRHCQPCCCHHACNQSLGPCLEAKVIPACHTYNKQLIYYFMRKTACCEIKDGGPVQRQFRQVSTLQVTLSCLITMPIKLVTWTVRKKESNIGGAVMTFRRRQEEKSKFPLDFWKKK